MILGEKEFKKPIFDELGQTEQILKVGEEIWIKGLNLEENPWMMSIPEDLREFQWFWCRS